MFFFAKKRLFQLKQNNQINLNYIFLAKNEYVYNEVILNNDNSIVTLLIGMETNIYLDIGMMPCRISSKEREENK